MEQQSQPMHNDDMNDHMNVMIQVDWFDGIKEWRENFTCQKSYLGFKKNLDLKRNRSINGLPFIVRHEVVYY